MPFAIKMPKLSPTMEEGTIVKWHKKEGDFVEADSLLVEIATDKATVEHSALDEGWLRKIILPEGGSATINEPIAIFTAKKEESIEGFLAPPEKKEEAPIEKKAFVPKTAPHDLQEAAFAPEPPLENYSFEYTASKGPASPLARKLAKEQGLDISSLHGSGPGGRVVKRDLEKAQKLSLFKQEKAPTTAPGSYEEIPLSPMRKAIAKRLQASKTFIPHFYIKQTIDADDLVLFYNQLKQVGVKISYNDLIIRATALSLRKHPDINVGFNSVNKTLIAFKTIDISVAVSLEGGLITPIIRHADYKDVTEIGTEVKALAEKAKAGKLADHEYKGGSFCISNLGMFGITEFTAVINPPQGAILAIGSIEQKAVVKKEKIVAGHTLALTLSIDHRVIDGSNAALFIKTLQNLLENPASLLL